MTFNKFEMSTIIYLSIKFVDSYKFEIKNEMSVIFVYILLISAMGKKMLSNCGFCHQSFSSKR